jgi:hypothetical protein
MDPLLLACSTYDNKLNSPGKQKRAVYQTKIDNYQDTDYPHDDIYDSGHEVYHVDTDTSEILINNTNSNRLVTMVIGIRIKRHSFQETSGTN